MFKLKHNKKSKEKKTEQVDKATEKKITKISFNVLAIFCIVMFCFSITPKGFQNDTFYTIKIGQLIRESGIDYQDHFSWHNLPYMYPHWLYDVAMSLIYDFMGGYTGLYISTIVLCIMLGILLYITNKKICKNDLFSFLLTIGQMMVMQPYIAARAQLVTFILFVLTIFVIEKFLEKPKIRHAIELVIIPIIIANIHSAVWPFYFILFMPYIGEYLVRLIIDLHIPYKVYNFYLKHEIKRTNEKLKKVKKTEVNNYQAYLVKLNKKIEENNSKYEKYLVRENDRRKNPYKLKIERNDNTKWLILIAIICVLTGLLTPIKDMPYTYTYRIMQGNTTKEISEHLPLVLIEEKYLLIPLAVTIALLIFTKAKIRLRDLFFVGGLTLLALMTRRQLSMFALFGGFVIARLLSEVIDMYDKNGSEEMIKYMTSVLGEIITVILIFVISYRAYKPIANDVYVSKKSYPVEACKWIKENLDYKNIKLFNDYNYGSYLLFEDIPVFIDSRCDLYTPEFNGTYDKDDNKYDGKDIFSDYINISSIGTYYEDKFEEYGIDYIITKSGSKLKMLISKDYNYDEIYKDKNFVIYQRLNVKKSE